VKVIKNDIKGYKGLTVPYTLICKSNVTKNLAILFPGMGYTVQGPLLRFSTELFLNKSFDVLEINYEYSNPNYNDFDMEEISEAIKYDVKVVIDKILENTAYENFYLIGKSLGTIAMCSELTREIFKEAKAVWLTPLLQREDVFSSMLKSNQKGLCFIGDNDHFYIEERFNQLMQNENLMSKLIPNVDHRFQYSNDVLRSIDVLKDVITVIERFSLSDENVKNLLV